MCRCWIINIDILAMYKYIIYTTIMANYQSYISYLYDFDIGEEIWTKTYIVHTMNNVVIYEFTMYMLINDCFVGLHILD